MSVIKIRIFHEIGSAANREKKLIRTLRIEQNSDKQLTAKKAGQILARNVPEFDDFAIRQGLVKGVEGFYASRTIKATEKCKFHYVWEHAIVSEENTE